MIGGFIKGWGRRNRWRTILQNVNPAPSVYGTLRIDKRIKSIDSTRSPQALEICLHIGCLAGIQNETSEQDP
ncbi:hypothetical protein AB1N83_010629 [Pleurotus pulmonarius]